MSINIALKSKGARLSEASWAFIVKNGERVDIKLIIGKLPEYTYLNCWHVDIEELFAQPVLIIWDSNDNYGMKKLTFVLRKV